MRPLVASVGARTVGRYGYSFSNSVARDRALIGSEVRSNHSGRPRCKPTISDGVMIVSGARLRFLANENRDVASAVTAKILDTPVIRSFQVIGQRKVQGRFVALRDSLHELIPLMPTHVFSSGRSLPLKAVNRSSGALELWPRLLRRPSQTGSYEFFAVPFALRCYQPIGGSSYCQVSVRRW